MSNHSEITVLNLQQFAAGVADEASNGQNGSLSALIQCGAKAVATLGKAFRFLHLKARAAAHSPLPRDSRGVNAHCGSFAHDMAVTFVRKKAERALNDGAFTDDIPADRGRLP